MAEDKKLNPEEEAEAIRFKAAEVVQAKYLGDTPIVMPHLDHRADARMIRDERKAAIEKWNKGGQEGVNPNVLVNKDDIIPLDRWSAEGRGDFEVVEVTRSTRAAHPAKEV